MVVAAYPDQASCYGARHAMERAILVTLSWLSRNNSAPAGAVRLIVPTLGFQTCSDAPPHNERSWIDMAEVMPYERGACERKQKKTEKMDLEPACAHHTEKATAASGPCSGRTSNSTPRLPTIQRTSLEREGGETRFMIALSCRFCCSAAALILVWGRDNAELTASSFVAAAFTVCSFRDAKRVEVALRERAGLESWFGLGYPVRDIHPATLERLQTQEAGGKRQERWH
ncbi:hypothetical protein B0T22DRAFT_251720 [Podospora appendiculata]|uniref:Uncharacterized protein n=1 Tax=Podospora appendiculata TaxID=314037 RepID=A0AAE0X2R8_9PEZI|nr:hypothetical protein B0T22DRAFT_251720 [Podospora appendiculata]